MSRIRRRLKPSVNADMVPMIDVVFQLVIFFMISSTFIQVPGIALTLPESETAEQVTVSELIVTIADNESVYLKQREALSGVIVEGDKSVSYEAMVKCLDLLRRNGFEQIGLEMRTEP